MKRHRIDENRLKRLYYEEDLTIAEVCKALGIYTDRLYQELELRGWPRREKGKPRDYGTKTIKPSGEDKERVNDWIRELTREIISR